MKLSPISVTARCGLAQVALPQSAILPSRRRVEAHAKRNKDTRGLQEIQQLREEAPQPAVPPAAPSAPAQPSTSAPPQPPAATASSSGATPTTQQAAVARSSSSSSISPATAPSSPSGSSGTDTDLLIKILGSVTAIMAVISVFYSIVFYGASNVVYVFKDQLSTITKKDFVPYSERRRMEQEVLQKLEQQRDEQAAATAQAAASAPEADAESSEFLNLLPGGAQR